MLAFVLTPMYKGLITQNNRCKHRLVGIVPIVAVRVKDGYVSRCLLCDVVGPLRENGESARLALLEE
jgi:hypothetical protein